MHNTQKSKLWLHEHKGGGSKSVVYLCDWSCYQLKIVLTIRHFMKAWSYKELIYSFYQTYYYKR